MLGMLRLAWQVAAQVLAWLQASIADGLWAAAAAAEVPAGPTAGACSSGGVDPNATGSHVACCAGLQECLGDWHRTGALLYLCMASCGQQLGTGLSSCARAAPLEPGASIWDVASGSQSCSSDRGIRGDVGFACASEDGVVDQTSIFVDMTATQDKVGCFVWQTDSCQYSMRSVRHIDFDVEWEDCPALWMAPLWTFSDPWAPDTGRQGLSGEVDFVEQCPVPTVATNLGCYNAGQGDGCWDAQHWGRSSSSEGLQHMTMTLDDEGNLQIDHCTGGKQRCTAVAKYANYLNTVYPTTEGRDNVYKLVSDVFNDRGGDPGWEGCQARKNPATACKYAVTNIRITSNSEAPIFPDPASKCFALNAEAQRPPSAASPASGDAADGDPLAAAAATLLVV